MFQSRLHQPGAVLFGVAGGLLAVAVGFVGAYFLFGTRSEARAATSIPEPSGRQASPSAEPTTPRLGPPALAAYLDHEVELVTAHGSARLTWAALGASIDSDEVGAIRASDLPALAARGSLP